MSGSAAFTDQPSSPGLAGETTEPGGGYHTWRNVGAAAGGRGECGGGMTLRVVMGLPLHPQRSGNNKGRVFGC